MTLPEYNSKHSTKASSTLSEERLDSLCLTTSLRNQAERAKKALSAADTVDLTCDQPTTDSRKVETVETVRYSVSKAEFEGSCDHLFQRALLPVTRLLDDLGTINLHFTTNRISVIILTLPHRDGAVGGRRDCAGGRVHEDT